MKQNTMLMIGGAIVVYYLWKKSQETTETTSEFANVGGKKRRKGVFYGNSACRDAGGKIAIHCGQTCGEGTVKIGGSHNAC